jgi:hypothetical protein
MTSALCVELSSRRLAVFRRITKGRSLRLALLLAALLSGSAVQADVASDWVGLADRAVDGPLVASPLRAQRERVAPALTALAIFEAANGVDRRYRSYLDLPPAEVPASADAAAVAAGHGVLAALYPERRSDLDDALALALAHIPHGPAREAGLALGRGAAQAALARPMFEGPTPEPDRPAGEVGRFVNPTPTIIAPWSLRAQFFFLTSDEEVMPPPPPTLTSERYALDVEEVRILGGLGRSGATPDTLRRARFLAGFSLEPVVRRAMERQPRLVDRARLLALVRMAQHDADGMISMAKMRYKTWRPINAIRNADRDGNPGTSRDADWSPVMTTPNHPEYPCGHCTVSSLTAILLEPHHSGPVEVASETPGPGVTMVFADWGAFQEAASLARIQGGMHFRFSNEAGQTMGRRIAEIAQERFAPLVLSPQLRSPTPVLKHSRATIKK